MKSKVCILLSAPTPYRNPFLKGLADRSDLDVQVLFLSKVCGPFDWHSDPECEYPHSFLDHPDWFKYRNYPQWIHPELPRLLREEEFDVVIIGGYFLVSQIYTALWCIKTGTPYVFWIESHDRGLKTSFLRKAFYRALVQPLLRRAKAHIAVGGYARDRIVKCGVDADCVSIILNSPDVDKWIKETDRLRHSRTKIRKELEFGSGPLLLFVGRMVPEKGVEELIEAYRTIKQEGSVKGLQILLVGEGPLLEPLKERCRRLGLDGIKFAGFKAPEKLYPYYAASDAFVLPSRYEPFGVVAHEAASSKLPLLLSDFCGTASELVREGENGFIFEAGNSGDLAETIKKLCARENEWSKMGEKSRKLAKMYGYTHGEEQFVKAVGISTGEAI